MAGRSYVVLAGALSRSYGRIVAEISLDVSHDDMAVDAVSRHKPLPGDVARHSGRRAQCKQVGGGGEGVAATLWVSVLISSDIVVGCIV